MMDNYLERLTLEGAGGRMETDDTRSTFRPAIENFGVSQFKLAIRQQNYEFSMRWGIQIRQFSKRSLLQLQWFLLHLTVQDRHRDLAAQCCVAQLVAVSWQGETKPWWIFMLRIPTSSMTLYSGMNKPFLNTIRRLLKTLLEWLRRKIDKKFLLSLSLGTMTPCITKKGFGLFSSWS